MLFSGEKDSAAARASSAASGCRPLRDASREAGQSRGLHITPRASDELTAMLHERLTLVTAVRLAGHLSGARSQAASIDAPEMPAASHGIFSRDDVSFDQRDKSRIGDAAHVEAMNTMPPAMEAYHHLATTQAPPNDGIG